MKTIEVNTAALVDEFHQLPAIIYKGDKNYIPHLTKDVENVFSNQNPFMETGEARRWLLKNESGKLIGRVAAYYSFAPSDNAEYPVGRMGFFECTNNQEAAFLLFDTAKDWLESKGIKAMEGPINFGERDKFWGLRINADSAPSYLENYQPHYYQSLFEAYGFREYFRQHSFEISRNTINLERLGKIAQRIIQKPAYSFQYFSLYSFGKHIDDFTTIYNAAWRKFEGFKPVTQAEISKEFEQLKPVLIPEFIWFAYVEDQPAGFIVMMPDVNQIFKYVNGKLNLIGKLKFLYYQLTKPMTKLKVLVFGIHPDYQNLGLDAALVYSFYKEVLKKPQYQSAEISWVGGFNPKMQSFMLGIGAKVCKEHITYRKLFDENLPFTPYSLGSY
ncbi:MAG: hypothetical protein NTX03_11750 [Bacteroidetes bacterium]|nr:hypothetical protein [Bacteroidota bacterium]